VRLVVLVERQVVEAVAAGLVADVSMDLFLADGIECDAIVDRLYLFVCFYLFI